MRHLIHAAAFALLLAPAAAHAGDKVKETADDAARTGVDAVVDSARTVGRTTKAAVKDGRGAARATWDANVDKTKRDAHYNAEATRAAANR
ncbi:MAG TPA: hypothetical protein VIA18_05965 [Polyangia bacterium]|jgi:hypothetical protein|nr:hypothetical protein [Polyangia bacterium]